MPKETDPKPEMRAISPGGEEVDTSGNTVTYLVNGETKWTVEIPDVKKVSGMVFGDVIVIVTDDKNQSYLSKKDGSPVRLCTSKNNTELVLIEGTSLTYYAPSEDLETDQQPSPLWSTDLETEIKSCHIRPTYILVWLPDGNCRFLDKQTGEPKEVM